MITTPAETSVATVLDLAAVPPPTPQPRAVAIGVFDGVHLGHRYVLRRLRRSAHGCGASPAVLTFHPHPRAVVGAGMPPQLCSLRRRVQLLEATGHVDECVVLPFNADVAQLDAPTFVTEVLARRLGARHVLVGANFRFGRGRAGDVATLGVLGADHGFTVEAVDLDHLTIEGDARRVSSTLIRERLADGDVAFARRALGRPHEIEGVATNAGHGAPPEPATIHPAPHTCLPAPGRYAARVRWQGRVGTPTMVTVHDDATLTAWELAAHATPACDLTVEILDVAATTAARRALPPS